MAHRAFSFRSRESLWLLRQITAPIDVRIKKIAVLTDFSESADVALHYAATIARGYQRASSWRMRICSQDAHMRRLRSRWSIKRSRTFGEVW